MSLVYPLPEVLWPRPWVIRGSSHGGHISRSSMMMSVPLGASPEELAVRTHEMGHIKWSPPRPDPKKHGVSPDTLLAVEDARIHMNLDLSGLSKEIAPLGKGSDPTPPSSLREAVLRTISCSNVALFDDFTSYYRSTGSAGSAVLGLVFGALRILARKRAGIVPFRMTVETAKWLDEKLGRVEEALKDGGEGAEKLLGDYEPAGPMDGSVKPRMLSPRSILRSIRFRSAPPNVWGRIEEIQEPDRPFECRPGWSARKSCPEEYGSFIRSPHRIYCDGRIFVRSKIRKHGTVLIDLSGSMRIDKETLRDFLHKLPGLEIAGYSGGRVKPADFTVGAMRILARNGRVCADDDVVRPINYNAGNIIDGPALEWLGTRPGPRIWVSDGDVRGVNDNGSANLTEDAALLCIRHRIRRIKTLDLAIQAIEMKVSLR